MDSYGKMNTIMGTEPPLSQEEKFEAMGSELQADGLVQRIIALIQKLGGDPDGKMYRGHALKKKGNNYSYEDNQFGSEDEIEAFIDQLIDTQSFTGFQQPGAGFRDEFREKNLMRSMRQ